MAEAEKPKVVDTATSLQTEEHEWKEITGFCDEVAQELAVGQIIKADEYSLFEAMSAVELMDEKMDPSFGANKVLSFEEARSSGKLPAASTITPSQIVGLAKQLLKLQMMWFEGYPMAQSLLTCLYFHHSQALLDDALLAPLMKAVRFQCGLALDIIREGDVQEEEDFVHNQSGAYLPLPTASDYSETVDALKAADASIQDGVTKATTDAAKQTWSTLLAFTRFSRIQSEKLSGLTASAAMFAPLLSQLETLSKEHPEHVPPEHAIQPLIGKRLYFSTHPRQIPEIPYADTISMWSTMIKQIQIVSQQLPNEFALDRLEHSILELVHAKANILVRSTWTLLAVSQNDFKVLGTKPMTDCIIQLAKEHYDLPEVVFQQAAMKEFLTEAAKSYTLHLRVCATNKARRLHRLTQMMREWETLIQIGSQMDAALRDDNEAFESVHYGYCMSFDWQLRSMLAYLQLGFDLELYSPHEILQIYWYQENLMFMRNRNMTMLLTFNLDMKNFVKTVERGGGKANKKNAKKTKIGAQPTKKSEMPKMTAYAHEVAAELSLVRGVVRILVGLYLEKKVVIEPEFELGSAQKRYLTRFRAFYKVHTPSPIFYQTWLEHKAQFNVAKFSDCTNMATNEFAECRKELEKILNPAHGQPALSEWKKAETQAKFKVAVANGVQVGMIVKMNLHKDATRKVSYNYDASRQFPVIALK